MSELLCERIRRLRKERGLSQGAMGARLTLGRQVISEWERGISVLRTRDIPRVSNILGVTTDYLLTGREAPQHAALIAAIRRTTSDPRVLALVERA